MFEIDLAWDRAARTGPQPTSHTLRVRISPLVQAGLGSGLPVMMAIAIDISGSMAGDKLEKAKRACETVAGLLRSSDRLWLAGYSTDLVKVAEGLQGGSEAARSVMAKIGRLSAQGVTRTDVALQWLEACLPSTPGTARVGILITDGIPTDPMGKQTTDHAALLQMAGRMGQAGISICAVGLGNARYFNSALLTQISDRGRGEFIYAEKPETLNQLLVNRLSASQRVAATDAALEIVRAKPGVTIKAACRFRPDYLPLEPVETAEGYHIEAGAVRGDTSTDVLLNVELPAQSTDVWSGAQDVLTVRLTGSGDLADLPASAARINNTESYSEAQRRDQDVDADRLNWDVNVFSDALIKVQEQDVSETVKMRKTGQLLTGMEQSARRAGKDHLADLAANQVTELRKTGKLDAHRATGLLTASRSLGSPAGAQPLPGSKQSRETGVLAEALSGND